MPDSTPLYPSSCLATTRQGRVLLFSYLLLALQSEIQNPKSNISSGLKTLDARHGTPDKSLPTDHCPPTTDHCSPLADASTDQTGQLTDPRAATLLPTQLLQPGELIILLIKPSAWYILLESLKFLAFLAALTALCLTPAVRNLLPMHRSDILLLAIGVGGVKLFWQFLEWLSRAYVLTDRRVVRVQGVLRVNVFECPIKNIQHTTASYSLPERLLGLGSIHFATSGTAWIEASWQMLSSPLEVHQIIIQTIDRYR